VQHLALHSTNIFKTLKKMREATSIGGFEFMDPPKNNYYEKLKIRIGYCLLSCLFAFLFSFFNYCHYYY
jgi:4-hydroxyphenylpyruvate dioxygenase-like putative hemolysin